MAYPKAVAKIYALRGPGMPGVSDRSLIRLGAMARLATRLLLLFASGLRGMQLMQVRGLGPIEPLLGLAARSSC